LHPSLTLLTAASIADTLYDQPMPADAETMFASDLISQLNQSITLELNQLVAL
jgi:hypothetical protein